jgi:SpoIVB peptidase S55
VPADLSARQNQAKLRPVRPVGNLRVLARLPLLLLRPIARLAEGRLIPLSVLAGAVLSAALGAGIAQALPADPADTMPLAEVKPGMKGYGLTVFSGTKPEKFDIEVISTLHNFRPSQDLILIKTPHPRLEVTRTVAGMSGSPIYLNGKMIGAYAYGWLFGSEAIAGVTPIRSMVDELNRPIPKTLVPRGGSPLPGVTPEPHAELGQRSFTGAPDAYDLPAHARQITARAAAATAPPEGTQLARATTPILMGGLGVGAMKMAGDLLAPMGLEPMQGGGSSKTQDPSAPTAYEDGGAIGVELVRGDVSAMGLGTVTRVSGNRLVAFGHPMLGGGIEALPTAIGRVNWIVATQNRSFKLGEAARSLGALVNDRQAAIVVDSTVKAPDFPMHIEITGVDGAPKPVWNVFVAHDQFMAPAFAAMAIGSAVEETTSERRDMTWRLTSKIKIARYGTITIVDFGSGNGNPVGSDDIARTRLVKALGALLNNPWEPVTIESIDSSVRVTFAREVVTLRGAKLLETEVDAGQPVKIRLDLEPYQGKIEPKVIELELPKGLLGRAEIELAPGYDVARPLPQPNSLAELIANLPNQTFDPQSIVATIRLVGMKEVGVAYNGKIAARLPQGAAEVLRPVSETNAPETFEAVVQTAIPLKAFLVGRDMVRVTMRSVLR